MGGEYFYLPPSFEPLGFSGFIVSSFSLLSGRLKTFYFLNEKLRLLCSLLIPEPGTSPNVVETQIEIVRVGNTETGNRILPSSILPIVSI